MIAVGFFRDLIKFLDISNFYVGFDIIQKGIYENGGGKNDERITLLCPKRR